MAAWYSLADFFLSRLDTEAAHRLAIRGLKSGWVPRDRQSDPPSLGVEVWHRRLSNPIGLAAGFDKNAEAPDARSEEHTSELQSHVNLVCRLLLEKKKKTLLK